MRRSVWHRVTLARTLALAVLAPALVVACSVAPTGPAVAGPLAVRAVPVGATMIAGTVVYTGNVETRARINLLPKIAGQVVTLNVETGSVVKQGDVIAELDHAVQDAQVAQATAGVAAAKARLATIQVGSRSEVVAQARANLQAAQANLTFMQNGGRPENVTAAQGNLAAAAGKLAGLQRGHEQAIAQATANLQGAQARLQQLKDGPTQDQIRVARQAVEAAKVAAYGADANKDGACNPRNPKYLCDAAQAQAGAAHTAVNTAQDQLVVLTDPPTADQLNQAQAAVDAAQAQLQLAQHPGSMADLNAASGVVQAAQAQLDLARAPYSSADLAKAQTAVDVADQQLKLAEAPYTQQDEDAARAAVQQAEAALQSASVARDQAIVHAPIDGVVADKPLNVGSMAAPTTPIVVLVDPTVDVAVNADATQASALKLGDAATITADALPGKAIPGTITELAPTVDPQARTTRVKVRPVSPDSGLKDGMLAQVALVTATHEGVLAVPSGAVVQRGGQLVVYVVAYGVATPVPVQVGLSDGASTEIVAGLEAGQLVVVGGQNRLAAGQPVVQK